MMTMLSFVMMASAQDAQRSGQLMMGGQRPGQQGQKPGQGGQEQGKRQGPPIVVTIDANGHALVRGKLVSVSGTSLTVKSWGMQFTVDASKAQITGSVKDISSFVAGDVVGVQGMLDEGGSGTITAENVRDWGAVQGPGLGMGSDQQGESDAGGPRMGPPGPNASGTIVMPPRDNASGTQGMPPRPMRPGMQPPGGDNPSGMPGMMPFAGPNASGTPGMQRPRDNQEMQQQLQRLMEQLKALRERVPEQQGQPGQTPQ